VLASQPREDSFSKKKKIFIKKTNKIKKTKNRTRGIERRRKTGGN
jgi:hypothetical protein